jgi:hypothetical protein
MSAIGVVTQGAVYHVAASDCVLNVVVETVFAFAFGRASIIVFWSVVVDNEIHCQCVN